MDHTGCRQLIRVLTHNNNVVESGSSPTQHCGPREAEVEVEAAAAAAMVGRPGGKVGTFHRVIIVRQNTVQLMTAGIWSI
jgi:hypothetical protein